MRGPFFTLLVALGVVAGCTASVRGYAGQAPHLDLKEYFDGPLVAWGIVQDHSGQVQRSVRVDMTGRWDGDTGLLEEDFTCSDGKPERRVWSFRKIDEHHYVGTGTINVALDDWMWLIQDGVLVNRSEIRKFGVRVGEVTIFFQKPGTTDAS